MTQRTVRFGKKTPGGAGTHTGHTGTHGHTEHTDSTQTNLTTPSQPTNAPTPHSTVRATESVADSTAAPAAAPEPTTPRGGTQKRPPPASQYPIAANPTCRLPLPDARAPPRACSKAVGEMKARAAHAYRPAVRPEPPRTSPMSSRPAREAGESQSVASRALESGAVHSIPKQV